MVLHIEEQPLLVQSIFWIAAAGFLISFAAVLVSILLVIVRTKALQSSETERHLSYGERQGRQFSRATSYLTDIRYRRLRNVQFAVTAGAFLSFGTMMAIIMIFGTNRP